MVRYHTFSDLKEVRSISEPILVAGFRFRIVALANLLPVDDSIDELDSYMYQTVTNMYAVSSRYGTLEDFKRLVDEAHGCSPFTAV
ncbi:hypothetical protein BVRB_5g112280 isoform A [Beta vulgaris subsp. vulgaris]|nr:hypothetical protein BVRB_5g112280 isoform A [Beta vulgaris subsp. vulgaris]